MTRRLGNSIGECNIGAVERITYYEGLFDELTRIQPNSEESERPEVRHKLELLAEYYDSGLWRTDYEMDEKGLLPCGLKRGVLSQDGLYDLLTDWQD